MQLTKNDIEKAELITAISNSFVADNDECGQAAVYGLILYLLESDYDIAWLYKAMSFFATTIESLLFVADFDDIIKALEYADTKGFRFYEYYYIRRQGELTEEKSSHLKTYISIADQQHIADLQKEREEDDRECQNFKKKPNVSEVWGTTI